MTDESTHIDDRLSSLLAAYHDVLVGTSASSIAAVQFEGLDVEALERLRKAQACLDFVESARRRVLQPDGSCSETVERGSSVESTFQDSTPTPPHPEMPARFGRFELLRPIAEGGFGIVYLARDPLLGREVALKIPKPSTLFVTTSRSRFLREAKLLAQLRHPSIVTVHEAGEFGQLCYIASEYCSGPNLKDYLKQSGGRLPYEVAAALAIDMAEGMEYVHRMGIVHRDLKPSNILLEVDSSCSDARPTRPFARITDFGIARIAGDVSDLTVTGTIMGTPQFMSPEQASGKHVDIGPASDIYSLGAVLYAMLTGTAPVAGETDLETLRNIETKDPQPIQRLTSDVPADLDAICLKCLEKNPFQRYESVTDLLSDLQRFRAGEPTLARPLGKPERLIRWFRREPTLAGLLTLSFAAPVIISVILVWSNIRLGKQLEETERERRHAEESEDLAIKAALEARNRAYAADMRLIAESIAQDSPLAIEPRLKPYVPSAGSPDLRGFEWWLYHKFLVDSTPSKSLTVREGGGGSLAINRSSTLAASAGADGVIRLWTVPSGEPAGELRGHDRCNIDGLAFSPDGKLLASGADDHMVRIWNVQDLKLQQSLAGHHDWVGAVAFLDDSQTLATGGADNAIIVWDLTGGREKFRLTGHNGAVRSLAFHHSTGTLFSASEDGTVCAWDIETAAPSTAVANGQIERLSQSWVRSLVLEPDHTSLLAIPFNDEHFHVNLTPGRFGLSRPVSGPQSLKNVRCAAVFGPATQPMAAYGLHDSTVRVRPYGRSGEVRILRGHGDAVDSLVGSTDAKVLVSISRDGEAKLWDLSSEQRVVRQCEIDEGRNQAAISPDGQLIAVGDATELTIIEFSTLKTIREFVIPGGPALRVQFAPDSSVIAVHCGGQPLRMHSLAGEVWEVGTPSPPSGGTIRFSSDGRRIARAQNSEILIFDVQSGEARETFHTAAAVSDIAFRDDTQLLATCRDGRLYRFALAKHDALPPVNLHSGELEELALSPDKRHIAIRAFHKVHILDATTFEVVATLPHVAYAGALCFLGEGKTLLTMEIGKPPLLWQTSTWQLLGSLGVVERCPEINASADGNRLIMYKSLALIAMDVAPSGE